MPETVLVVDAILFDMDGTLVDSTAGVEGAWHAFSKTYPGIDVKDILSSAHGVRTVDNLKNYCGIQDLELLEKEALRFEQEIVNTAAQNPNAGIVLLPGVSDAMKEAGFVSKRLGPRRHLPNPLWAICTSATRAYASQALAVAGVPVPDVFVAAEDVKQGKPFPDPYLLGAEKCGVDPKNCVVFEDAPSGIRSGNAAGCKTIALLTTHSREQVDAAQPDYVIQNMTQVSIRCLPGGVEIRIEA